MILTLMDYKGRVVEHDIGDLDDIARIVIRIVSGDEIAVVIHKDYSFETYDTSIRDIDYDDGYYTIYWPNRGINRLHDPRFLKRKTSYDFARILFMEGGIERV